MSLLLQSEGADRLSSMGLTQPDAEALGRKQDRLDAMMVRHMMQAMRLGGPSGQPDPIAHTFACSKQLNIDAAPPYTIKQSINQCSMGSQM